VYALVDLGRLGEEVVEEDEKDRRRLPLYSRENSSYWYIAGKDECEAWDAMKR
jgi:hypothetical protein